MIRRRLIFVLPVLLFSLLPWPTIAAQYNYIDISNPFLRKTPSPCRCLKLPPRTRRPCPWPGLHRSAWHIILISQGILPSVIRRPFLEDPQTMNLTGSGIRYRNWTVIGAELLVTGSVVVRDGDVEFELRLFDTVKEKMLVGKRYRGSADDHSQVARRFGSEVVFAITGSRGFF
jgi:TolB protein